VSSTGVTSLIFFIYLPYIHHGSAIKSFAGQVYVLDGNKLLVTNDGTTWETLPSDAYFTEMEFLSSGQLLLGGESGTIAKLTFKKQ
jgi:hypothetical protein